jgi:crossover junction endodeoxyribonuclease RusA
MTASITSAIGREAVAGMGGPARRGAGSPTPGPVAAGVGLGPAATPTSLRPGAGAAPAGGDTPRSWRIEMPAGMELLNSNHRGHWSRRQRLTKDLRWAACCLARSALVPQLERAHVEAVYEPPDRRRRDPANLYPSIKACVDGLVDARVLPDDDAAHLVGPDMRLSTTPHPRGRLVLIITELPTPAPEATDA